MIRVICFLLLYLCLPASIAAANEQLVGGELEREVVITLDSGEILKGPLIEETAEFYKLDHVILGEITIPIIRVELLEYVEAGIGNEPENMPQPIVPPADPEPVVIPHDEPEQEAEEKKTAEAKQEPKPEVKPIWSGSLEMGVNGSEGNTQMQRGRVVLDAKRKTERETLDLRIRYQAAQTNSETSENRLFARAKNEWATSKARWRLFLEGSAERDEFRDFDWRVTGNAGYAYEWIKNDATNLTFRAGLGGSTEFGSPNDELDPEGTLAYELRHKINKQMSLTSNGEVILDLRETGEYRTRITAAIDTNLDESGAWKLRIGIEDRYESNTTRAKKNDFDYFVSLVYRF